MRRRFPQTFGNTQSAEVAGRRPVEYPRMARIVAEINPSGDVENCGYTTEFTLRRLSGENPNGVSFNTGPTFPVEHQRWQGTMIAFDRVRTATSVAINDTAGNPFRSIFRLFRSAGSGTRGMIVIYYHRRGGHIISVANVGGVVGVFEGQDWDDAKAAGVITCEEVANKRYNRSGSGYIGYGIVSWGDPTGER